MTEAVRYEVKDGIAHLVLDDPSQSANTMNEAYRASMEKAVNAFCDDIESQGDAIKGAVVSSAKSTFFAGGDLKLMTQATPDDAQALFDNVESIKATLRKLETSGKPVVAAINGAALGGGFEIALACHHRVAAEGRYEIGLPEATLGLLPGGGGVTRTVRMFGIADALMKVLLQGPRMKPAKALSIGLVDEVVAPDDLMSTAIAWVEANAGNEEAATQPWDRKGYQMPGGKPTTPSLAAILPSFPANLRKQVKGADYRAPRNIMSAAVEGALVDFDTASRIESRYLVELLVGQQFKNMTQAFFFDLGAINAGKSRPDGIAPTKAEKVAVLGAGMMGAGIAYVSAQAGMQVVLKDISLEAAEKGKAYSEKLLDKARRARPHHHREARRGAGTHPAHRRLRRSRGLRLRRRGRLRVGQAQARGVRARSRRSSSPTRCSAPTPRRCPSRAWPRASRVPKDFIGIHFFSPVDKMPLVEIIAGEETSDEAIARVFDFTKAIKKTPIVVGDSRGFFTSRVIGTFVNEGIGMLAEGVSPVSIERATTMAGFPAPVLQLSDELNLELMTKIRNESKAAVEEAGGTWVGNAGEGVIDQMVDRGPPGPPQGRGLLRVRRRQARGPVVAAWPRSSRSTTSSPTIEDLKERLDVHHEPRVGQVPRRGRAAHGARRQHRLDLRHRLPGPSRAARSSTSTAVMVAEGRVGRLKGAGFYEYVDGKRVGLWSGLAEKFPVSDAQPDIEDLKERLTFIMSLESVKCLDEGVLRTVPDANIGSIFGIGFPANQGGVLQYINGYEAADGTIGVQAFVDRAQVLADAYGERFTPPQSLLEKAKNGEKYV